MKTAGLEPEIQNSGESRSSLEFYRVRICAYLSQLSFSLLNSLDIFIYYLDLGFGVPMTGVQKTAFAGMTPAPSVGTGYGAVKSDRVDDCSGREVTA
mgnify:CR=1 FL=1